MTKMKNAALAEARERRSELVGLSHRIHAHPELAFEEARASAWLCETLAEAGFDVQKGVADLPTAFVATVGDGPLHIGFCAEYDALPGIGHACGHNIIAATAVGAALAAARVADEAGLRITVLGTPAEESGGGKILMLERGAFDGIDVAMMVHPTPVDAVTPRLVAAAHFDVHYHGRDAHAAASPELGINAADALTVAQTSIGLLRQHLHPGEQVHGIVTRGGDMPNIVPSHTTAKYMIRSETAEGLDGLHQRVRSCFEAGAMATGCRLEISGDEARYAHVVHDSEISEIYRTNATALGRVFPAPNPGAPRGGPSTDMGNVSHKIRSIHPFIGIDSLPAVNHQPEFAAHCVTEAADQALHDGAVALAWTAIDLGVAGR